ncbi:MAG: PhoX family phosphatase, partial [Nitrosomonadales bacterium]|nr:PhoX family phosphatase [Nitrosomonadales bacterium]
MSSALHPDGKLNPSDSVCNSSFNDSIGELIERRLLTRRTFLKRSLGISAMAVLSGTALIDSLINSAQAATPTLSPLGGIGFSSVPANVLPMTDAVTVPSGYQAKVLVSWGDSLTDASHWDPSGAMDEATQLHCYGGHTDGMHFFPFPGAGKSAQENSRGLLVTNSEYVDPAMVNNITPASAYATALITLDMVRAQQAGHGLNIVELQQDKESNWSVRRPSAFNRRITGNTPCQVSGPAAGHHLLKTASDHSGQEILGTLNNCAMGHTPWGTYLSCEENFNGYFGSMDSSFTPTAHERRYGISKGGFGYRWHEADPRFELTDNRNEPNRFGWVVEINPWNPGSEPVKRTALGRFKHEGATVAMDDNGRVALYMGDDERNEYVYKFVCANKFKANSPAANRDMLDNGILYVGKFNADGTGVWIPLIWGQNGLTPENGFDSQADVVIKARQAGDRVGATMMDRPEWAAVHPTTGEVYLTLTNNNRRGSKTASVNSPDGSTSAATANPVVDAANPRSDNDYGHIIRWREADGRVDATSFEWDIFVQCGDKTTAKTLAGSYTAGEFGGQSVGYAGNINGDDYGAPDGMWFDRDGRLWIQTDQAGDAKGDWVNIGGNVMM